MKMKFLILAFSSILQAETPKTFEWAPKENPAKPSAPTTSLNSVPVKPGQQNTGSQRFDQIRQRMLEMQKRMSQDFQSFFQADPFMPDPQIFNQIPALGGSFPDLNAAEGVAIKDMKNFILVEVPLKGEAPDAFSFEVRENMLLITKRRTEEKKAEDSESRSEMYSFSSSSTSLGLPSRVKEEFTTNVHQDKIILTLIKIK